MTALSFLFETLAVHLLDILVAGGCAFFLVRSNWKGTVAWVVLALYAAAIIGTLIGPLGVADRSYAGPLIGLTAALIGGYFGAISKLGKPPK